MLDKKSGEHFKSNYFRHDGENFFGIFSKNEAEKQLKGIAKRKYGWEGLTIRPLILENLPGIQ